MNNILVSASNPEDWKKGYSARTLAYCWHAANSIPKGSEPLRPIVEEWSKDSSPDKEKQHKFLYEELGLSSPIPNDFKLNAGMNELALTTLPNGIVLYFAWIHGDETYLEI